MTGEKSPDFACGQILYSLRMSKLNYLVKETPYSTYVTIRKKFVRIANDIPSTVSDDNTTTDKEGEFLAVKERNKDLEKRLALAKVEFEELDIEKVSLMKRISEIEDHIEDQFRKERLLNEQIKNVAAEREELKVMVDKITKERRTVTKEFEDNIVILEHTVESRDEQILALEEELKELKVEITPVNCENCEKNVKSENDNHKDNEHADNADDIPSTSKCGKCNYESDDELNMETHVKTNHKLKCDLCDFVAETKDKLDTHELFEHNFPCPNCLNIFRTPNKYKVHICKLEVVNPSHQNLYTKNWIDGNGCNSIFCRELSQEVIILHCEKCISNRRTCYWSPYTLTVKINAVAHLELDKFTKEPNHKLREILWSKLIESTD